MYLVVQIFNQPAISFLRDQPSSLDSHLLKLVRQLLPFSKPPEKNWQSQLRRYFIIYVKELKLAFYEHDKIFAFIHSGYQAEQAAEGSFGARTEL